MNIEKEKITWCMKNQKEIEEKAIEIVGKAMGEKAWNDSMSGAFLPRYNIDCAHVIQLMFGGSREEIEKQLMSVAEKTEKRLSNSRGITR